ncbi:MAG: hypothetical protein WCG90_05405 [Chitinophagia bacterium]
MKLIRFAFISVLIIGSIITAIAGLFPSMVVTSRAVEVNATKSQIQHCVKDLAAWKGWMSDWKDQAVILQDSIAQIGTQSIQMLSSNDSTIYLNWVAIGQAPYQVKLEWLPLKEGTYVIHWSFEQHVKWYPWEKFQTLLNEKVLGAKMEEELQHLTACIVSNNTDSK